MIKYSFLVPVYNVKDYLHKCVDSLLAQDYPTGNYEIILVDDGSMDGSERICDEYSRKYSNIKTIHQENKGLLLARGTGVKNSVGEYLLFIDSDDYVDSDLLKVIDRYIEKYSPDCLCFSYYTEYSNRTIPKSITSKEYEILSAKETFIRFAPSDKYNTIWNKAVKGSLLREHADEIYTFKTNIGEDKVQTAFLLKYSNTVIFVRKCLYHYIIRDSSIAHYKTETDIHDVIKVYNKLDSVISDGINRLGVSDIQGANLFYNYKVNALNSVMDHIYKLNKRTGISKSEKCECLGRIMQQNVVFFSDGRTYYKALKIYNKYRYRLLIREKYKCLVMIDVLLKGLKLLLPN